MMNLSAPIGETSTQKIKSKQEGKHAKTATQIAAYCDGLELSNS